LLFKNYKLYQLSEINNISILNDFNCSIEYDIDNFLKTKALDFEKRDVSKTYLLIDILNKKIVGYFTLSLTTFLINSKISKTKIYKIDGFNKNKQCLNFYLIGQLGIDDKYRKLHKSEGLGTLLLTLAIEKIKQAQKLISGRYILVDSVKNKKVIQFYQDNDFNILLEDENSIKMIYRL